MAANKPSLDTIFCAAIEIASEDERAAYLARACGDDHDLQARVEKLLHAHARAGSFLEAPAASPAATIEEPLIERPGTVIGPYKLLEQIGEGGFGVVFMAEQQSLRRKVALKVIKPGMDSKQVIARFEAERQALALMDHPNIARVLDAGATDTGRPYFVMELVRGIPITQFCDENRLTTQERLRLFVSVCQAVQHAHHKGIIHRDLKPSNVLVTLHDGTPVPKVIDFGIAKAIGQQLTDKTLFTGFAQMVGTPLYMSPEQAALSGLDVDTRSDIYSLGVLLYELLTGTTPFDKERLQRSAYEEVLRIIREEEPPKPSTRITTQGQAAETISTQRQSDPKRLSRLLAGELDWIVMKTLEKDRNRRYESASALAADVQRHLNQEPVQACPPSVGYRLKKFARRNTGKLAAGACVLLVLAILTAGLGWILHDWQTRRTEAEARVFEALEVAEPKLREGNPWDPELIAAARKAAAQLASGVVREEFRQQVEQVLADMVMLAKLENIRMKQAAPKQEGNLSKTEIDRDYAQAFQEYGIDIEELGMHEAATRIRQRPITVHLAVALDNWALAREQAGGSNWKQLLAMAQEADSDRWRCAFREARASGRKEDLEKVLAAAPVQELPPTTLALLGAVSQKEKSAAKLAVAALREGQQLYPGDFWINERLAYLLTFVTEPPQYEEAISFYRAALALRPQSYFTHLNLGGALRGKGALDEAAVACRRAIRLRPDDANAHGNLGLILADKGALDEAIAAYKEAIRLQPDDCGTYTNLGSALKDKGALDEAIAAHKRAIHLKPDFGMALSNLGNALAKKGALEEAIAAHEEAIHREPDYVPAHFNLGVVLQDKGALDEAIAAYKEAIRLQPDHVGAYNNLGYALRAKGACDEAIVAFKEGLQRKPDCVLLHYSLGNVLSATGRAVEAESAFRAALTFGEQQVAKFPAKPEYRQQLATTYYVLGVGLVLLGRVAEAETAFRTALKLQEQLVADFPTVLDYAVDLGATYFCLGALKLEESKGESAAAFEWLAKAIDTLSAALAKDPHHAKARKFLRMAYRQPIGPRYNRHQYAEALPDLDRAIELAEGSERDELRVFRADALFRTGRTAQAIAEADSLTQGNNVPSETLYMAACIYALASAALKDNSQQAENHAIKAIALLGRAQATGYFQEPGRIAHLKQDTDFDQLRSRGDYQRRIQELEKAHQKGK
jgi:serine/threonine protein kinase/tetratricopeptide (TPR) repeat protein